MYVIPQADILEQSTNSKEDHNRITSVICSTSFNTQMKPNMFWISFCIFHQTHRLKKMIKGVIKC